ncbi:hypothetical protein ILUMI_25142 [Ignelater luminosus]|uniref:Uncharacterized protein n=1 Tax=Ignelater luminosus TaxID=2038154 RepID=A0A8K0CC85_IGNLU|nr:hypothetical protein ILUMI_25142 [Ignelater luminosus]
MKLKGKRFFSDENLLRAWENERTSLPDETWQSWFKDWFRRMEECIECVPPENIAELRFDAARHNEHINGLPKARFRCLHGCRALRYNPTPMGKIICSCTVLYNTMCQTFNVLMPEDEVFLRLPREPLQPNAAGYNWFIEENTLRQLIVNTHFRNI